MYSSSRCFVEWKEEFISHERGNRIVHYFLKDSNGDSIISVVGTERSVRHMSYVVAEEFLDACGNESTMHAGFKWRSRREVVDWLTSMLSKQHLTREQSRSVANDATNALGSGNLPMSARRSNIDDYMGRLARDLKGHDSDIVWSGNSWTCGKQLKHYPAFCRNGTTIVIQSFVFVMAKDEDYYIAHLEDMYEDRKKLKKVKVRWFHHNQELKCAIHLRNPHPKEVLITPYAQVISAECVDGPATVLTPEHYEKCVSASHHASIERIHLCCRQFKGNKVKPFDLSKLRGYFDQAVLLHMGSNPTYLNLDAEKKEEFSGGENMKPRGKRARSCRRRDIFVRHHSSARLSDLSQLMTHKPAFKSLRKGLSRKRLRPITRTEPSRGHISDYKVDQNIELLCQDSGIRGCWFKCTILEVAQKRIKVQYDDVQDEDGCGNLKEWIPAFRLAMRDKLGMRYPGRPTIRPCPPNDQTCHAVGIGSAVDARWSDGWWEGILVALDDCKDGRLQVYFPGENIFLNVARKNLRISRDWVSEQWVDIEPKPEILDALSAAISPDTKSSDLSSYCKISSSTKSNHVEEEKLDFAASDAKFDGGSVSFHKDVAELKQLSSTEPDTVKGEKLDAVFDGHSSLLEEDSTNSVEENKLIPAVLASRDDLEEQRELVNDEMELPLEEKGYVNCDPLIGDGNCDILIEDEEDCNLTSNDSTPINDSSDKASNDMEANKDHDDHDDGRGEDDVCGAVNKLGKLEDETVAQNPEAVEPMDVGA